MVRSRHQSRVYPRLALWSQIGDSRFACRRLEPSIHLRAGKLHRLRPLLGLRDQGLAERLRRHDQWRGASTLSRGRSARVRSACGIQADAAIRTHDRDGQGSDGTTSQSGFRARALHRLACAHHRAGRNRTAHPPACALYRTGVGHDRRQSGLRSGPCARREGTRRIGSRVCSTFARPLSDGVSAPSGSGRLLAWSAIERAAR